MKYILFVQLKRNYAFIEGHLFKDVAPHKRYPVIDRGACNRAIRDEAGKVIWISNTAFSKYFVGYST